MHQMNPKIFKLLRRYLGLSQADLGDRLGRSHTCIHLYETGRLPIPAEVNERMLEMLSPEMMQELGFQLGVALAQF